jgi:hypothetical protein
MTQALYAHMNNKIKKANKQKKPLDVSPLALPFSLYSTENIKV